MYFLELHPRLYHMTSDGAWPPIQRHGLLSTAAILDRAGNERLGLEQQRRLDNVSVSVDGDAFVGVHSSRIFRFESCPIRPTQATRDLSDLESPSPPGMQPNSMS